MSRLVLFAAILITGCGGAGSVTTRPVTGEIVRTHDRALWECQPDGTNCSGPTNLSMSPVDAAASSTKLYFVDGTTTLYACGTGGGGCSQQTIPFPATSVTVGPSEQVVVVSSSGRVAVCNPGCSEVSTPNP